MRKALEGPGSRKKTNQQTKQPKDAKGHPGSIRSRLRTLDTPCEATTPAAAGGVRRSKHARPSRAVQSAARTTGCDRLADARVASAAELPGNERRGILGRRTHASRRHARTASGSGALRRDARDLRTRTDAPQRCVADAGAQRARRGGRCLLSPSPLCSLLSSLSSLSLSLGPSALSRRAPQWGPCCFVCCLVFFRELGPSNAFLIRKLTPYTPCTLLRRPLILKPWY